MKTIIAFNGAHKCQSLSNKRRMKCLKNKSKQNGTNRPIEDGTSIILLQLLKMAKSSVWECFVMAFTKSFRLNSGTSDTKTYRGRHSTEVAFALAKLQTQLPSTAKKDYATFIIGQFKRILEKFAGIFIWLAPGLPSLRTTAIKIVAEYLCQLSWAPLIHF